MADPRPLLILVGAQALGLLLTGGWWAQLPAGERWQRLDTIAQQEQARSLPPRTLVAQGHWLVEHRLARLQGLTGIMALGLLVGLGEGSARRTQDPLRGVRLKHWTLGVIGLALLPGLAGGLMLAPWGWSSLGVASSGAAWLAVVGFLVISGRPAIP